MSEDPNFKLTKLNFILIYTIFSLQNNSNIKAYCLRPWKGRLGGEDKNPSS